MVNWTKNNFIKLITKMKNIKFKIIALIAFASTSLFGQISLEQTYSGSAGLSQVKTGEFYYYNFNANTLICNISDINHSPITEIPIPLDTDETLSTITYLSKNLFDSDDGLELIYTYSYWYQVDTTWYLSYDSKIMNEDGSVLLDLPGAQYLDIINQANGSKLMSWVYDFSISSYPIETNVYALPGQYNDIKESLSNKLDMQAYPNPCQQHIYLPLKDNIQKVQILNSNGQLINELSGNNQLILQYQVDQLSPGVYFARQTDISGAIYNQKFIIR